MGHQRSPMAKYDSLNLNGSNNPTKNARAGAKPPVIQQGAASSQIQRDSIALCFTTLAH